MRPLVMIFVVMGRSSSCLVYQEMKPLSLLVRAVLALRTLPVADELGCGGDDITLLRFLIIGSELPNLRQFICRPR